LLNIARTTIKNITRFEQGRTLDNQVVADSGPTEANAGQLALEDALELAAEQGIKPTRLSASP
jgi:hypothetical protein